jgi:uncharacterized protein Smg (DUF494 family)
MPKPSPLASTVFTDDEIDAMAENRRQLINAYERIENLQDALRGLIGLIQLLSHNASIPLEAREAMVDNHRVIDAQELLQ